MKKISIGELTAAVRGELILGNEDNFIEKVITDSREDGSGSVFFALTGEKNDGHDFLVQSLKNGTEAIVVSDRAKTMKALEEFDGTQPAVILVDDTKRSLQWLSQWYLDGLDLKAKIGVTGSVGKTSTRDFLYYVLSEKYRTARSIKNFNNSFGLPLSLLSFPEDTEAAVIELGMDGKGSIDLLAELVRPETAVITNVGVSHLENFPKEGRQGILNTKLEITNYFDDDSTLIINASNDMLEDLDMASRGIKGSLVRVGMSDGCDYAVGNVRDKGTDGISFDLMKDGLTYPVELAVPGAHNAINATLAVACGVRYGLTVEEAIRGLGSVELTEKRLTLKEKNGITIIDDTYNAAPDSVKSAINTLMATKVGEEGRHVLITGDMGELGAEAERGHRSVGAYAFEKGVDVLIAIGEMSNWTVEGWQEAANAAGHETKNVREVPYIVADCVTGHAAEHFDDIEMVISGVMDHIFEGDCILLKASRFMHLEKIVKHIMDN